ncbi:MAG TPA: methyltransferase domain-containing protein [Herpetosiphonaceae bacterium]
MQDIHRGYSTVDQANDVIFLFRFLDVADTVPAIQEYRQKMLDLAPMLPGQCVLDVGCGVGHMALRFAEIVGSSGQVVGIDKSEIFIREAQRRAQQRNLAVDFKVGDAQQLDLPDQSVDLCWTERVLMYVENPEQALDEMIRVLKPGGQLIIFDFDYDATIIDVKNRDLTRRIVRILSDSVPSSWIGRQAQRLFKERGLQEVQATIPVIRTNFTPYKMVFGGTLSQAVKDGLLDAEELDGWWRELEQSEQAGTFFVGSPGFIVYGRKPPAS